MCSCITYAPSVNQGVSQTGVTNWNGAYTLTQTGGAFSPNYTWTGPSNDFHEAIYNSATCGGSPFGSATFTRHISVGIDCSSGVISVTVNTTGGGRYFLGSGSLYTYTSPITNTYSNPGCTGIAGSPYNIGADGGTVTLS